MLKRLAAALIMSLGLASGAWAQQPAHGEPNPCLQAAHELAVAAEQKQMTSEALGKIDDQLDRMEDLCDADRVSEAMALAKDIEEVIKSH